MMPPVSLSGAMQEARYLFFTGKGGVGKTTAACAAALHLLDRAGDGERILLFSTDPAHSLSDSLQVCIGDRRTEVARNGPSGAVLLAREMDAATALHTFKARHGTLLTEIAERGTFLDESDIQGFLDLSLPGMDEVMALLELCEEDRGGEYSRIIVDTAPTGHTERLLRIPDVFTRWIDALDRMSEKHRFILRQFVRGGRLQEDETSLFLRDMTERVERVRSILFGPDTAFVLVTIPEAMAVEETVRYFDFLKRHGTTVTDLIINRVERPNGDDCDYCSARAAGQQRWRRRIGEAFSALPRHPVPLLPNEVRGPDALRRVAAFTWEGAASPAWCGEMTRLSAPAIQPAGCAGPDSAAAAMLRSPRRLLVFGGKGGVGKTTAAAAAALALAEANPCGSVLALSTDPAHSLSDSFGEPIGRFKKGVAGVENLDAIEIDPTPRFEALKERYHTWTDQLFASITPDAGWSIQFDREAMRDLVELAPPGIDEIAALGTITDLLEEGQYTCLVLDTAPTGHLIRFLELPAVALSWVHTFMRLLLKYRDVVHWDNSIAEELIALSKSIKGVTNLLTDADACEFVGVANPDRMNLEEMARLNETLVRLRVPMSRLLINNIATQEAAASCGFCAARREEQTMVINEFRDRLGSGLSLVGAPQQPAEVTGPDGLRRHFQQWTTC